MCIAHQLEEVEERQKKGEAHEPKQTKTIQTYRVQDTWMPSLENWGGGLKIFCGYITSLPYYALPTQME